VSWVRRREIEDCRSKMVESGSDLESADPKILPGANSKLQTPNSKLSQKLFLHVDMDAFFVSVEVRDNPSLLGKPVAVGGASGNKGIITAASYEARKFGLKAGMPAVQARRLCPDCIFLSLDPHKYTYASAQIMDLLESFSPDVRILSVDEASLEISGCLKLWGSPEEVGRKVKRAIREKVGLPSTAGVAVNRLVAKVAADSAKPDGLRVIEPGSEAAFLAPMPVEKMCGIGPATGQALNRLGFHTLGELAGASDEMMRLRFGVLGPMLAKMARGEYTGRMQQDDERGTLEKSMGHERTFSEAVANLPDLRAWVVALGEMVARRVRQGEMLGRVLTLKLRYTDFETISHQSVLPVQTDDEELIIEYGWKLLQEAWREGCPVRLLGLSLGELKERRTQPEQVDIFLGRELIRREALYRAVDRVKDRFGEKALLRAMGQKWRVRRNYITFGRA